jgi:hypothetical protein
MQPKFDQNKNIEILTIYPEYDGMVKKIISRYCPFKAVICQDSLVLETK